MFGKLKEDLRAYSIANKSSAPVERMMTALQKASTKNGNKNIFRQWTYKHNFKSIHWGFYYAVLLMQSKKCACASFHTFSGLMQYMSHCRLQRGAIFPTICQTPNNQFCMLWIQFLFLLCLLHSYFPTWHIDVKLATQVKQSLLVWKAISRLCGWLHLSADICLVIS